nr:MAG TPA: CCAAT/enhancer-binding protein beta [Caudoviricetes sp.]
MNKRMKKKQQLEQKIQGLECELAVVSKENMELLNKIGSITAELNTLSQSVKRHEDICGQNVEQTNKEFEAIKKELKRSKKSFFKR